MHVQFCTHAIQVASYIASYVHMPKLAASFPWQAHMYAAFGVAQKNGCMAGHGCMGPGNEAKRVPCHRNKVTKKSVIMVLVDFRKV